MHWHAEAPALRGAETLLAGQAWHTSPASKASARHSTHVSPPAPAKPAAHRQEEEEEEEEEVRLRFRSE